MGDSDRISDLLELLALAICIHSERLVISDLYRIYRESLIAKMGATPISDLAIAMSLSLMQLLTVNRSIEVHCTHNKSLSRSLTVNRPLGYDFFYLLDYIDFHEFQSAAIGEKKNWT